MEIYTVATIVNTLASGKVNNNVQGSTVGAIIAGLEWVAKFFSRK